MTHSISSQNMSMTQEQKNRVERVFTKSKIIDISKAISNEIKQDSLLLIRENQIKELEYKIKSLEKEYKQTLISIATNNSLIKESSKEADNISKDLIRKEKFKWSGFNLYGGSELATSDLNNTSLNLEIMYETKKIHLGLKTELTGYNSFTPFVKMRFKIF